MCREDLRNGFLLPTLGSKRDIGIGRPETHGVWSLGVVAAAGLLGAILFIGGENSLYHRLSYGPSVSLK